jgi:tetratricopeptide (TPR) repeat protein
MKGVYVVKSVEDKIADVEPRKQSESRGVYVVRASEEVINKYGDIIYEFVDDSGLFVLICNDKFFYQSFKRSVVFELGIESELIQIVHEPELAMSKIDDFIKNGLAPFVFLEHSMNGKSNMQLLSLIRNDYLKMPVIILAREVDQNHLMQFYEEGANHVLNMSASVNEIIRKLVHVLKPQTEIDELVLAGDKLNMDNRFEDAIRVANTILTKRSKSPQAHIIMGDAYKGLARRKAAMAEYLLAERDSKMFIDPLKKMFLMHAEDQNREGMCEYLIKLDTMSPLNFNRKMKIGDLHYELGKVDEAEDYYDKAITSAESEARAIVGEMSLDIAEKLVETDPRRASKYFKKSLALIKDSKGFSSMNTFNRLGISLRKAGLWEDAVEAYVVAGKLSPGDENIQYNLGLAYYAGKDYASAVERMLVALKINPKMYVGNPDVAFNMGLVFKDSGNQPQADKMIRHVREIAPDYEGVQEFLSAQTA